MNRAKKPPREKRGSFFKVKILNRRRHEREAERTAAAAKKAEVELRSNNGR